MATCVFRPLGKPFKVELAWGEGKKWARENRLFMLDECGEEATCVGPDGTPRCKAHKKKTMKKSDGYASS